jgi:hypothetical protein
MKDEAEDERKKGGDESGVVELRRCAQVGAKDQLHHKKQKDQQATAKPCRPHLNVGQRVFSPLGGQPVFLVRQISQGKPARPL